MKKWLVAMAVGALTLAFAAPALAAGPGPGPQVSRFTCTGIIDSVDPAADTLVVKVRTMSNTWKGAKATRGKTVEIVVTESTVILARQLRANGTLSRATALAFTDLKPGRAVNVGGTAVTENGTTQLKATRIVMLVPTYTFQSNATIVSVSADPADTSFVAKIKTMSRSWNGWKQLRSLRGKDITIVVTPATRIYTRQIGTDGSVAPAVPASFADLVAGNRVHIAGKVEAAADGSNLYRATRIIEFLPAPVAP